MLGGKVEQGAPHDLYREGCSAKTSAGFKNLGPLETFLTLLRQTREDALRRARVGVCARVREQLALELRTVDVVQSNGCVTRDAPDLSHLPQGLAGDDVARVGVVVTGRDAFMLTTWMRIFLAGAYMSSQRHR